MIYDYSISKQNGEETLFIFLNFDEEFARLKTKEKKKKLNEIIREFIKKNDIDFKGTKIALISGGLLIGTLVLASPKQNTYTISATPEYTNSVVLMEENVPEIDLSQYQTSPILVEKEEIIASKTETPPVNTTSATSSQKKPTTSTSSSQNSPIKNASTSSSSNAPIKEEIVDNNIYVTVKRSTGVVERIELEEYVLGVVAAEMPASFHVEALKTQAIIARTYALRALERGLVLTDDSSTQNYKTTDAMRAMWGSSFNTYYSKIKNAVSATKGIYITYNGTIIDAVYHSTSNGKTENSENVWSNAFPYLVSVSSPYDTTNSSFSKTVEISYETIAAKLGIFLSSESEIAILNKTIGDRVEKVSLDGAIFTGVQFRNALGLRSADFDIVKTPTGLSITTRGYGHGVGLSQYGAQGMAANGYSYEAILKHYYTGITISHR